LLEDKYSEFDDYRMTIARFFCQYILSLDRNLYLVNSIDVGAKDAFNIINFYVGLV